MNKKKYFSFIIIFILIALPSFSESIEHTIESGDTLYSLSRKYDVSVDDIMVNNGIYSPDQLKIGIKLKISPNNLVFNEDRGYTDKTEYLVKKGDTLYSISRRNGISVSELREMNNLSENHILFPGNKLFINSETDNTVKSVLIEPEIIQNSLYWPINGTRFKMDGKLGGIRISADAYSYVRSIAAGKVVLAEPYRGFGNVILIDVNGYIYLYGGNEDVFVNVGEEVAAGTRIGRLGMSDFTNGKKDMFFSVLKDGKPIDTSTAPRG